MLLLNVADSARHMIFERRAGLQSIRAILGMITTKMVHICLKNGRVHNHHECAVNM